MCLFIVVLNFFLILDYKVVVFGVCVRDYKSNFVGKKFGLCFNVLI